MTECPNCKLPVTTTQCISCGTTVREIGPDDFPPITWEEIKDSVIERLEIEDEWKIESENDFTWWPTFLPQSIYVTGRFEIDFDGQKEVGIRVTVETVLGSAVDRDAALTAVEELNRDYPFGSFVVLDDNRIAMLLSIFFHGRNKGLLKLLPEEVLVQATIATDVAQKLSSSGLINVTRISHPVSGARLDVDELVANVYAGSEFSPLVDMSHLLMMRPAVRKAWKDATLRSGGEQGFENEEVTFMTFPDRFDCAVGWRDDEFPSTKFGPSIQIWNNLATLRQPLPPEAMNALNLDLALNTEFAVGHLGGITQLWNSADGYEFNSVRHIAQLPTYFVGSVYGSPDAMMQNIINAIYQATASARYIHWEMNEAHSQSPRN